jgi:D-galactarolactone cycloisomerase
MYYRDDKPEPEMLDELLEEAAGYLAQGYQFLKVKLGKNLAFDKQLIRRFRECFPETLLAGDANHAYNFKEALTIAKVLEANGYTWFEEPLSPEDLSGMARLRQVCSIPIAAGECEQTRFGFARLAEQESLDIFQPDLAYCGGITEFLKINGIASAAHVDLVPHCWGLKINQAAAAAAIAILPENPGRFECRPIYLEMDQTEHAVRDSIFTKAHVIKEGYLQFNDLPGLGVELDEAILQKFIMDSTNDAQARFAEVE